MTVSGARSPVVLLLTSPKNTDMQQLMDTHLIGEIIVHEVVWPEIQICLLEYIAYTTYPVLTYACQYNVLYLTEDFLTPSSSKAHSKNLLTQHLSSGMRS